MTSTTSSQRRRLVLAGVVLTLLLAAVFTLGSLDTPFDPRSWRENLALYAVSCVITAVFIVFLLIIFRTIFRLWAERSRDQLGARFKTKMVVGAVAISLLPVIFMFFMSYALLNRTLARWFPRPIEIASEQSRALQQEMSHAEFQRLSRLADLWTVDSHTAQAERCKLADAYWQLNVDGTIETFVYCAHSFAINGGAAPADRQKPPALAQNIPSGAQIPRRASMIFL